LLTAVGDTLFFTVPAGAGAKAGLWKSDGTSEGTVRVDAPLPQTVLTSFHGRAFFVGNVGTEWGLWKSDGTTQGTVLVKNLHNDPSGQGDFSLDCCPTVAGGSLFVSISDQLWRSDGTAAGTSVVKDVVASGMADIAGMLYFYGAHVGLNDCALWKSDGTSPGTVEVSPDPCPVRLTDFGGRALFWSPVQSTTGHGLWVSDGTPGGTIRIKDIDPGATFGDLDPGARRFLVVGATAFFAATDGASGTELWRTDGTSVGTTMLADIFPGPRDSVPKGLIDFGGTVFFAANDGVHGRELWSFTA
jgi:ELWxxDGT repeat protein